MAKIDDVVRGKNRVDNLPPLQKRVLSELNKRKDEGFTYADPDFKRIFPGLNLNAVDWTLWSLYDQGLIDKYKAKGQRKQHFGSHAAIRELNRRLKATEGSTNSDQSGGRQVV